MDQAKEKEWSYEELRKADITIALLAMEQAIAALKQGDRAKAIPLIDLAKRATTRPPVPF